MRKLTGYIGALIIVFALMGSILAGYALNVNGSSSVINEYERVTDVSGLYTHSQEPSYIDYNPASNYIGYSTETIAYTNTPVNPSMAGMGYFTMKRITDNSVIEIDNTKSLTINGDNKGVITTGGSYWRAIFYCNDILISINDNYNYCYLTINNNGWVEYTINNVTISINNNNITASGNNTENSDFNYTVNKSDCIVYWTGADFDYYNNRTLSQYNGTIPSYFSDEWPIYTFGLASGNYISSNNNKIHNWSTGTDYNGWLFTYTDASNNNKHSDNINYAGSYHVYYPKNVFKSALGITYTETNRVNNYLINTDPGSTVTNTATIDLMSISASEYYQGPYPELQGNYMVSQYSIPINGYSVSQTYMEPVYTDNTGYNQDGRVVHAYKLSDVLSTYTIPTGTDKLTITANSDDVRSYTYPINAPVSVTTDIDMNIVGFNPGDGSVSWSLIDNRAGYKDYIIYDIQSNVATIYYYDGSVKATGTPDQLLVVFVENTLNYSKYSGGIFAPGETFPNTYSSMVEMANRARPFITIQSTVVNPANNHYMDVTKGISIKNDNISNVIWNNEYTNGNIQLLFRSENTSGIYHNDIIVGDNTISIDYNDGFSVTLNGGDPVAVGKWRNIVLNMDLRTGELSAIPVRTFNSYTNVVLDTASIVIGDMVNPSPTNKIEWAPTSNSLMFNVYTTAVFMNTYGVVMVNPQLDITEYFTDLNGFYRMRLYNFSVLGSSITVNGVTADVSNNSITIDEQTVQIKDMAITYADGHAYISDSNVNIDLGEVVNYNVSMNGAWYFETELLKGYTSQKMVYTWDWGDFILNNTQFCIMYIGIALIGLIVARRYCSLSITDYIVLIASFAIALTVQVVA